MIKISFESDMVMSTISKAILNLTDCTTVCLGDIHYDEAQGIVEIYLQRREILEFKRLYWIWFGGEDKRVFGPTRIKSLLIIRQVEGVEIDVDDRLVAEHNSCFTVMFGVQMEKNEVYLGSLEEVRGKQLCQISIKVKKLNIEYNEAVVKM
jgi:hypothetical protein